MSVTTRTGVADMCAAIPVASRPTMAPSTQLPYPRLTARYVALKDQPSKVRLDKANATTAGVLAGEFLAAAAAFEELNLDGAGVDTEFFPRTRTDTKKSPKSQTRTFGWAMAMKGVDQLPVDGDPDLNFRYVEREIIPTRTKPQLQFQHADGKHVRVDLVLANAKSGRPVVGELKIATDKDPYTGLVQALAGAAQLVSKRQRGRLAQLSRPVSAFEDDPLVDIYVLLGNFPTAGRHRLQQLERALTLASELEADKDLGTLLGRIRIVALMRKGRGPVRATSRPPVAV